MDVKYIGGDEPWTLPFGDHFYSSSQTTFNKSDKNKFISSSDLEAIARRHEFEPLYTINDNEKQRKSSSVSNENPHWMNAGVFFTDQTIDPCITGIHKTDFNDTYGHTFCYLCSINYPHDHQRTKPRDHSQRRKLIPYNNPKALKSRSASLDRTGVNSAKSNSVPYRFIVRTGTGQTHGTRAQVFLYMYGTENNWTSINLRAGRNSNSDGFPNGSIRTFCLKGPEIGQLRHLNVNLVGARSDRDWFLKEIEITNLNTSVTWLCEFNCWLPQKSDQEHYQIKPTVVPEKDFSPDDLSVYILLIRTGDKRYAGTDSVIQVRIRGTKGETRKLPITTNHSDLFEQGQLDTFAIVGWDIGDLVELTVESDKTQFASDWDLKEMTMWKNLPAGGRKQIRVYFPFNQWIGQKVSTRKTKGEIFESTDPPRGPTCYTISVRTGQAFGAGTNANVYIIIYGKSGRTVIHHLDNPLKDDFERKTTSDFTIMDIDVGQIEKIKIWHDNKGPGAAWFLDTVIIRKKHSTCRSITNIFQQRIDKLSKIFYAQAYETLKKDHRIRMASTSDINLKSKDYDGLDSRSILRSPVVYDKKNLQKKVSWNEQSSTDLKRIQSPDKRPTSAEAGRFNHQSYWISSHTFKNNRWEIKSIEQTKSFEIDQPTRTLLSSDRSTLDNKIKSAANDKDDDVYEFEANRWLGKDKDDGKVELDLKPKSVQLSSHSQNETKSTDLKKKQIQPPDDNEHLTKHQLKPLERSPRSVTPLDRSPHDQSKTKFDNFLNSNQRIEQNSSRLSKHDDESPFHSDHHKILSSDRDLIKRISGEPSHYPRSTPILNSPRSNLTNTNSLLNPKPMTRSNIELPSPRTTRKDVYSSAYGTAPTNDF